MVSKVLLHGIHIDSMTTKEKVTEKEQSVRSLLETLRKQLNSERIKFDSIPNNWSYIASLSHTETVLKDLVAYIEATPS
jgi:hypothetical protein